MGNEATFLILNYLMMVFMDESIDQDSKLNLGLVFVVVIA